MEAEIDGVQVGTHHGRNDSVHGLRAFMHWVHTRPGVRGGRGGVAGGDGA